MAAFHQFLVLFQNVKLLTGRTQIWSKGSRQCFSTHCALFKSRPSTVGVPAWAKAAKKRRAQVLYLEKKKTAQQMQAEFRLADTEANRSDFLTSTRVGVHRPKLSQQKVRTKMALTDNEDMLVFYHPEQSYPVHHTQAVKASDWISTEHSSTEDYKDNLTESEITRIQSLQNADPKLWTVDILSDMFKVKPFAIVTAAPLTSEQELELEVEQDFQSRLSEYEKAEYEHFKATERRKHLKRMKRNARS